MLVACGGVLGSSDDDDPPTPPAPDAGPDVAADVPIVGEDVVAPRTPTTIGVFRSSLNLFYLRYANEPGIADRTIVFDAGGASPAPFAGHWSVGNPRDSVGIHYPLVPEQHFLQPDGGVATLGFGFAAPDTVPVVGDWNGDGVSTIGIYRGSTSAFFLNDANQNGDATYVFEFAARNGFPVAGDWDGDGKDGIGIFFPPGDGSATATFFLKNTLGPGDADILFNVATTSAALPIAGDWDGNGTVTVGWFDPPTGTFHLLERNADLSPERTVIFGGAADAIPVAGKWQN